MLSDHPAAGFRTAAIDLGASSGRVSVVETGAGELRASSVHRFATRTVQLGRRLVWDLPGIYAEIEIGLAAAAATGRIDSVGIDAWGCDYGLIGPGGDMGGLPICYRDPRTTEPGDDGVSAVDRMHSAIDWATYYSITGTQFQPFNTIYQLVEDSRCGRLRHGETALMIPDLIAYWLTGCRTAEVTNVSTTGLIDPWRRQLADGLIEPLENATGFTQHPSLRPIPLIAHWRGLLEPGCIIGPVTDDVAHRTGLPAGTPVVAIASHDTASAVVAVPDADDRQWAFISSGTWSLVGVEVPEPIVTEAGRDANFTNELGVAGTVRYLRNVSGLWVLTECVRAWTAVDASISLNGLVDAAANVTAGKLFDVNDPSLLAAGADMPERIAHLVGQDDLTPVETARVILESLAHSYADSITQAGELSGRPVEVVHIVGGGSQNALLCQLTADATGLPVVAGPVEASTLGNGLVQAWALGNWSAGVRQSKGTISLADLTAMRRLVASTQPLVRYEAKKGTL